MDNFCPCFYIIYATSWHCAIDYLYYVLSCNRPSKHRRIITLSYKWQHIVIHQLFHIYFSNKYVQRITIFEYLSKKTLRKITYILYYIFGEGRVINNLSHKIGLRCNLNSTFVIQVDIWYCNWMTLNTSNKQLINFTKKVQNRLSLKSIPKLFHCVLT